MDSIVVHGKNYISSKRAAELMGYTQDYVGQLARSGKIDAERIGGIWYVAEHEFTQHTNSLQGSEIPNTTNIQSEKGIVMFEGARYISSKRAAELMGYTQDYVGQLARSGKIKAQQIGRSWYIPESVVLSTTQKQVQKDEQEQDHKEKKAEISQHAESMVHPALAGGDRESSYEIPKTISTPLETYLSYINTPKVSYSRDESPLIPTLQRQQRLVLHKILDDESKNKTQQKTVVAKRNTSTIDTGYKSTPQVLEHILNPLSDELDIFEEKKGRKILSPLLLTAGSVALIVFILSASFVPYTHTFLSEEKESGQYGASVVESVPTNTETSTILERISSFTIGLFEKELEYTSNIAH